MRGAESLANDLAKRPRQWRRNRHPDSGGDPEPRIWRDALLFLSNGPFVQQLERGSHNRIFSLELLKIGGLSSGQSPDLTTISGPRWSTEVVNEVGKIKRRNGLIAAKIDNRMAIERMRAKKNDFQIHAIWTSRMACENLAASAIRDDWQPTAVNTVNLLCGKRRFVIFLRLA